MKLFKIIILGALTAFTLVAHAQTVDELKDRISARNNDIKQLEEEIKGYQVQINDLGSQADSLRNTLLELDVSQRKLQSSLALTQAKIDNTNYELRQLSLQIDDKSDRIGDSR